MNIAFYYLIFYYTLLVFAVFFRIELSNKQFYLLNFLFLTAVIILAYNFVPSSTFDLYRYYQFLDRYKNMTWDQSLIHGQYSSTIITNFYFYIMSGVEDRGLFSAIPTGITFSIILMAVKNFRQKYKLSFQSYSLFMLGIISVASLIGIVSGIRQNLSWALLMVAVYYEFFRTKSNKTIKVLLYILPALVHLSSAPLIVIRLIVIFTKKFNFLKYIVVIWPLAIGLINSVSFILPSVLQSSFDQLLFHTSYEGVTITYKRIFAVLGYLIFFYLAKKVNILNSKKSSFLFNKEYYKYYIAVILFGMSSIFVDIILFGRIMEFVVYLSLPLIIDLFNTKFHIRKLLIFILVFLYIWLFYLQDIAPGFFSQTYSLL